MDKQNRENLENTQAQMRKGTLEFCILLLIANAKKMYTSNILEELEKHKLIVVEGTLYPLLNRLKREGLLSYTWEESEVGPPRKYYSITKEGSEAIKFLTKSWKSLSNSLTSLLNHYEQNH